MKKGSGIRLLLVLTLLVTMALTVSGLDLFDVVDNDFTYIYTETKINLSDEAVNIYSVSEEAAVLSVNYIEPEAVIVNTILVDADPEADLLIGFQYDYVSTLNANGFDLWEESLRIAERSKPEGLLRTINLI